MSTLYVDASLTGNVGDKVTVNGVEYTIGTDAFTSINDAVNAASATEANTIVIAAGTYNEDITLDARTMEQKADIKFIAANGADVTLTGLVTLGYYEKKVGAKAWAANIEFENITFDQATAAQHSIDIQQVADFSMTNCTIIGDGEYGILGTSVDNGATITGCTFQNAGIQSAGSFGTNLLFDDCTFDDSRVNIQSGNSVTIQDSTFNSTVTDANVDDSFYCVRSNDIPITIKDTKFNIDSTVTGVAADQAKWGVLWQRNAGGTKWSVENIEVNYTDAAMEQTELLFNKNGTTTAANEAGRITINGMTSTSNEVEDILAKSEGMLNASVDGVSYVMDDGVVQSKTAENQLLVSAAVSSLENGEKIVVDGYTYIVGETAFATINAAVTQAKTSTEKITIAIAEGEYTENVNFGPRTFVEDGKTYVGGITFKAVDGADVKINGYFQCNGTLGNLKDITFDGLTITNSTKNGGYFAPIMFGDNYTGKTASGITVENCTLNSTAVNGSSIGVALTMGLTCNGITIKDNTINAECAVYGGDGNLISNLAVKDNTLNGSETIGNYDYWGVVYIYNSGAGNEVSGNEISDSALKAIRVRKGNGIVFEDNTVTNCDIVEVTDGSVISGNVVDGEELTFPIYDGTGKLFVCQGHAGEEGDYVVIDGIAYEVGKDVSNSFVDALKNVTADTTDIVITGDVTESATADNIKVELSQDLKISGGNVNWNAGSGWVWFTKAEGAESANLTFEDFELTGASSNTKVFYFSDGVYTTVDADSAIEIYNGAIQPGATVKVEDGGKFHSIKEALQIQADGDKRGALIVEGENADVYTKYVNVYGDASVTDSGFSAYDYINVRDAGVFTADNSLIEIGADQTGTWHYNPVGNGLGQLKVSGADSVFNLTNDSTLKASGNITNAGTINIENSTLIADGTLASGGTVAAAQNKDVVTNNGTINVSGESTLNIRELAGNGLDFADGTTLVDSYINYTGSNAMALDGVSFKGNNTINAASYATNGATITVEEGASLKSTGGRWALGGNANWNVNGTIENAKDLTAEEKAALTPNFEVAGLSLSTGGGEAVLNVNDAYVVYTSYSSNKNTNQGGGKITMNYTNSVVESNFKYEVGQTKDGYDAEKAPEVVLNLKDSVFTLKNYFTNNHAKGTVNVDNSELTATAFGNVGEFTAENGSVVEFTLVNNALNDWRGKGGLNAGTITIDASDMTIHNTGATLEFYNVGDIVLTNGATLTVDKLYNSEAASLTGGGNIDTVFADMSGTITIDADSLLTVTGTFFNESTITIDASGFTSGTRKVIDLNGTESLNGAVTVTGLEEGITVAYGDDGDVLLTDAAQDVLYVSTAYANEKFGAEVDGKVVGVNAFGSLADALAAKTSATTEIRVANDVSEELSGKTISGKIVADGENAVTIADSANSTYVNLNNTEIGKDVTLDAKYFFLYGDNTIDGNVKSSTTFYSSGKLTLNGNAEVYTTMSRNYGSLEDGIYIVGTAAAGEGKNADVQYKSINYLGHYSGTFSVKDTAAEFGYILLNGSNDGDIQAQLVLDNASVKTIGGPNTQPGQVLMNDDAAIIATNDSVLDFRGPKDFGYLSMGENNSISLTDSALLLGKQGQGTNNLAGTITLVNSDLSSLGSINNSGTITIDANSTITATAINNTGTITIDAKGYTGDTVKVIDVDQALTGVTLKNAANSYYLTYGEDGDVYLTKSPDYIYVNSDYNSSTEGWGYDKFSSYNGAYAFSSVNAKKATMVFEKTTTISGNCIGKNDTGIAAIVVKDGATIGNANSKWDAVQHLTIEGGGVLQSARPASAGVGNTHVKNHWVIGEADSEKQAKIKFIHGSDVPYQTMSVALLSGLNRSITANNALIEVGDMGLQSKASFTDTTLTIDGVLAIRGTSLYKTTMTDSTVNIKGHNLMNEPTYYSTVGTILATLTMDNTDLTVDDGSDTTVAEKVWLGYTGNTAQTLTVTNGSTITVEKGTEVAVANKVTVSDSAINVGVLNASDTTYKSFYFNQLEYSTEYYAVLLDSEGNELERVSGTTGKSSRTFYPKFADQPAGEYTVKCYKAADDTYIGEKTVEYTAVGTMDLTNSDLYAEDIMLAGNNVSMDIESTIGFNSITGGQIVVTNADTYVDNEGVNDGNYLILDYTGDGEMTEADYKLILGEENWHANYTVFNNDLYLTDQDLSAIYVNSAWAGLEVGESTPDGKIYGFNAASNMTEVSNMIATDGSDTTIKFESDIETAGDVMFNYGTGDINFTADEAVTIKQTSYACGFYFVNSQLESDKKSNITVGENVTFELSDNVSDFAVWYGPTLTVDGTITGGANWGSLYIFYGEGHTINSTGTVSTGRVQYGFTDLTVDGGTIDTNYLLVEGAVFNAVNGANIDAGVIHDSNNGGMRYGASEFNIDGANVTAGGINLQYADSTMNLNDATLEVTGTFTNAADVVLTGTNTVKAAFAGTGRIVVDGATLDSETAITSGNKIQVLGDSTMDGAKVATAASENVNIGAWDGSEAGTLTLDNNAEFKFGGAVYVGSGEENSAAALNVKNGASIGMTTGAWDGSIYLRKDGELNVTEGGKAEFSYANFKGNVLVDGEGSELTTNGSVIDAAEINISNGALATMGTSSDRVTKLIDGASINVESDGTLAGTNMELLGKLTIDVAAGDAREITILLMPEGSNEGESITASVAQGSSSVDVYTNHLTDGNYTVIVMDGTNGKTSSATVTNGKLVVNGGNLDLDTLDTGVSSATVTGESTVKIGNIKGNALEIFDAALTDSNIGGGNVIFNGDTTISGTNTLNGFNKVLNGSTLTIAEEAELTANYLLAGEDNYFNFGNDEENKGGTININGKVKGTQVYADANGVINVAKGGTLNAEVIAVENGEKAGETAGILNVDGKVQSVFLNVFSGGTANINDGAYVQLGEHETDQLLLQLGADSVVNVAGELNVQGSANVAANGSLKVNGGDLTVAKTLTNKGTVSVEGESTLNVATLSGSSIDLLDGAIIKDSTVGGTVYVDGDVTFRGDNVFGMITDYGTYYNPTAPSKWTVEKGASVTLTTGVYGLGYGDNVTVNGELTDAKAAYEAGLTDDDASLITYGSFVTQNNSAGKNTTNYLTVTDAYVKISDAAHDQSLKSHDIDNYGKYEFTFTNSALVANAFNFNFAENGGVYDFSLTDSAFESSLFRFESVGSTFTADNSVVKATGTTSIGANMEFVNNSEFSAGNVANGGNITVTDSTFDVDSLDANSKMYKITFSSAMTSNKNLKIQAVDADGNVIDGSDVTIRVVKNDKTTAVVVDGDAAGIVISGLDNTSYQTELISNGTFTVSGESTVKAAVTGDMIFADGVVLGADTALTVDGNITSDGAVTFDWSDVAANKLSAKTLTINNVELPTDAAVTVFDGVADVENMVINGSTVANNQVVLGGLVYDIVFGDSDVTMNVSSDVYDPMTGGITSITQGEGGYTFTVENNVTGGEGDYTYSFAATDANGKELALTSNGLEFTLTDIPAAGTDAIFVTMTVTDAYGESTKYTAEAFAADVADYKAPEFAVEPEAAINKKSVKLTWTATDETEIAGYEIIFDGEVYEIGFGVSGKASSMTFNNLSEGDHTYVIKAYDGAGNLLASEEKVVTIKLNSNLSTNGVSQIVGFDAAAGKVGYLDNAGSVAPEWKGIWEWEGEEAGVWEVVGVGKFAGSEADQDGILLFNKTNNVYAAWTDLNSDDYGYVSLESVDAGYKTVGLANFNGNEYDDILMVNEDGRIGVVMDGTTYQEVWSNDEGADIEVIGSGSFGAADGLDSLIVKNNTENTYELWHNNASYESNDWSMTKLWDADSDWTVAAVGDFSGDGIDDIVVWQESTGYMFALEDGDASNYRWVGELDPNSWEVAAVGDYDGNGQEDLLLRETASGWGGLGYWGGAYCENWTDLNARIENDKNGSNFQVIA